MLNIFKKKNKTVETTKPAKIPNHVAFICDGNRCWAKERGLPATEGYLVSENNFEKFVDWFIDKGVSTISFFLFSTENWGRPKKEVDLLMSLFTRVIKKNFKHAIKKNLRYKVIGSRKRIPSKLAKLCDDLEKQSAKGTKGTIVVAINYGGRDEIIRAVNKYGKDFDKMMDTADLPDIDLLVRTSNKHRISNFMLWKAAYAELYFVKPYWPELISSEKLWQDVLDEFSRRSRTFGE